MTEPIELSADTQREIEKMAIKQVEMIMESARKCVDLMMSTATGLQLRAGIVAIDNQDRQACGVPTGCD